MGDYQRMGQGSPLPPGTWAVSKNLYPWPTAFASETQFPQLYNGKTYHVVVY